MMSSEQIHERALEVAARYKRREAELVDVIQQVEEHRVFVRLGCSSLFKYVVGKLGLSKDVAYPLITIARAARRVPELKSKLQSGAMTMSNARRVAAVITPENQSEWIKKAL